MGKKPCFFIIKFFLSCSLLFLSQSRFEKCFLQIGACRLWKFFKHALIFYISSSIFIAYIFFYCFYYFCLIILKLYFPLILQVPPQKVVCTPLFSVLYQVPMAPWKFSLNILLFFLLPLPFSLPDENGLPAL